MELKKIVLIFSQEKKLLGTVLVLFLVLSWLFYFVQPRYYRSDLMVNVTRLGTQKTDDYRFDEFYRLQADERFADTVVRWLEAPRIREDICRETGAGCNPKIRARRLSSQYVAISYKTKEKEVGIKEAQALFKVLRKETEKLNRYQKNKNWFTLVTEEPVVKLTVWSKGKILITGLILGLFFGFWSVLIKYYWNKSV